MKAKWICRGVQWYDSAGGGQTWVLWVKMGRTRIQKIDGKWTLKQLGYQIGLPEDSCARPSCS